MTNLHIRAASLSTAIGGFILLSSLTAHSQVTQEWAARFDGPGTGDDRANAIAVDPAGNVYVTGQGGIAGSSVDYATIKYNAQGVQQWLATYNGTGNSTDIAIAIAVDGSGNVYVTGSSIGSNSSDEDYVTIKYDNSGAEQWVARYNGPAGAPDEPFALAVDDLGNVYVTGRSNRTGGHFEGHDYLTIKYNALGAEQWIVRFNGPGNDWDEARAIAVDGEGNVYVTGTAGFDAGTAYHDVYTFKYNSAGAVQWVATYNGTGNNWDEAVALAIDGAGNVYVTGHSSGISWDYATIKYNAAGSQQWVGIYNAPVTGFPPDVPLALAVANDGSVLVTGASNQDYGTVRYNSAGVEQWDARHGAGGLFDAANSIAVDGAGDVYVTGTSADNIVTIKYSSGGTQQWLQQYSGPGSGEEGAQAITVAGGNVYVTGHSPGAATGLDFATIKYSQATAAIQPVAGPAPTRLGLAQNFPNPFNPSTTIRFDLPAPDSSVRLRVYDPLGREVAALVGGQLIQGTYEVAWDAAAHPSGIYFYALEAGGATLTRKMILAK
jgi:hypothetical protein